MDIPFCWNPDLAYELAVEEQSGVNIFCIDNAMYRLDVEVLKVEVEKIEPDKIILYGSYPEYRYIKQYLTYFKEAVVRGFPETPLRIKTEKGAVPPRNLDLLPSPSWNLIPVEDYFRNSPLPYTMDTATITRRAVYKSRWNGKAQSPKKVAETLRYLKLRYNYDYITFQDDFTENIDWTYGFLKRLDDYDLTGLFIWSCQADPQKIDRNLIVKMRESGCRLIDYGVADATITRDMPYMTRLQAAIHSAKTLSVQPLIQTVIGDPETTKTDILEMAKFLKSNDLLHKPKIAEPYPDTPLYEKIKNQIQDLDKHLLQINESFINYTKWTDSQLLGIRELMALGDLERLEKI